MNLGKVGLIGRFKPLHNGALALLESACENSDEVIIGIGSSNKYNARNPFTAKETKEMIDCALNNRFNNYSFIYVPDFGHILEFQDGKKWTEFILKEFGRLDHFISGNEYVKKLLKENYDIIDSYKIVPSDKRIRLKGAEVRYEIARDGNWKLLVPEKVSQYMENNGLVERFRREFGLETLASVIHCDFDNNESMRKEKMHAGEL